MGETTGRITLWGIEVFLATADEGSISAAARRLGASPSGVSQQLTNLETALGTSLMNRSIRPVVLTPAGETFRRRAATIAYEAAQARAEVAAQDLTHLTDFRLGMIEDLRTNCAIVSFCWKPKQAIGCLTILIPGRWT
jgi:DNA-binding transcriptional LysR family regulator